MAKRPNVLFIITDQHNAKVLGHAGHPDVQTPHLDRLASEGVRMASAISQNPICTPSRVSFLSGQYCHNHGYYGLNGPNPGGLPNVFGHFRRAGYRTGAVGKIHCPEYWIESDTDWFRESNRQCSVGGCPEYDAYLAEHGLAADRDDDRMPEKTGGGQPLDARASRMPYEHCVEGWIVRQAMEFLGESAGGEAPFFLEVSLPRPHQIYTPSEPFWSMYDESSLTLPPNADYDLRAAGKAPHLVRTAAQQREGHWLLFEPRTFEAGRMRKLHGYLGCVSQCDHAVGELLDFVDAKGLAEDTIVLYTSDHGDYACEHGIMEKAPGICSDAITRVPMLWRWPGRFAAGHRVEELVEAVDVSATLASLAGLEPLETSDGKDVSHLLGGGRGAVRSVGVTEFAWSKSIRRGGHRLVWYPREMFPEEHPDGFRELYDLEADPWEMRNLAREPEHHRTVCELERALLDWLVVTTRPTTVLPHVRFGGAQAVTRYRNTTNADGKVHPDRLRGLRHRNYL